MRPEKDQLGTLKFIAIGVVLMLLMDHFVFGGKRSYIEELRTKPVAEAPPPVRVVPPDGKEFFEAPLPEPVAEPAPEPENTPDALMEKEKAPDTPLVPKAESKKQSMKAFVPHGNPKIAIIIDDIGMDVRRSREAINLPAPVTMAFLPYAPKTREMARDAKAKGHSLIIHTPMEADDVNLNIGPGGLKSSMSADQMNAAFGVMLNSFDGYEGINNHMGSRLTQDSAAMTRIMAKLKEKNLFFVDSKTSSKSVAIARADDAGVPHASRDVFLDHVDSAGSVQQALNYTEELALRRGYAIAIGHPKDHTIAALRTWIPAMQAKGIEIVPVKALLTAASQRVIPSEGGETRLDPPNKSGDDIVGSGDDKEKTEDIAPPPDMFPTQETGVTFSTELPEGAAQGAP